MNPHQKNLIDDLAALRRAKNLAELEAARWAVRHERLGGAYNRRQLFHALNELRFCQRDLAILEDQFWNCAGAGQPGELLPFAPVAAPRSSNTLTK